MIMALYIIVSILIIITIIIITIIIITIMLQGKNIPPGITNLKTAAGEQISASRDKFIQVNFSKRKYFGFDFHVVCKH